jgi:hypothetical protein
MLPDNAPVLFMGELSARDPVELFNEPVPSNASESKSWSTGTQFRDHFPIAGRWLSSTLEMLFGPSPFATFLRLSKGGLQIPTA